MTLLHANATQKTRTLFEKYIFLLWLVNFGLTSIHPMAVLPKDIFHWVGPLRLLPEASKDILLSAPFLIFLHAAILICLVLFLLDKMKTFSAVSACLSITLEEGMVRSIGYVNHSDIAILYALYLITILRVIDPLWLKSQRGRDPKDKTVNLHAIPIVFTLMIFCFAYMFLGIYRLVHGGVEIYTEGWLSWWILINTLQPSLTDFGLGMLVIEHEWLRNVMHLGFPIGTALEILAPLALISRRFRYLFLAFMVPFHLLIYLFMNIFFWQNMALYILFWDGSARVRLKPARHIIGRGFH